MNTITKHALAAFALAAALCTAAPARADTDRTT